MPFGSGPIQRRGQFRFGLGRLKLGRIRPPTLGGSFWTVVVAAAPLIFLMYQYGKARTYDPYGGFWSRVGFMWTDTSKMVGNSFEGLYRFVARGSCPQLPSPRMTGRGMCWSAFRSSNWTVRIQKSGQRSGGRITLRPSSVYIMRLLNRSGALYSRLKQEWNERRRCVPSARCDGDL